MRPLRLLTFCLAASLVPAAQAYEVRTADGRSMEALSIARLKEGYALRTEEGPVTLKEGAIDFYATFRANLSEDAGNVLAFRQGGFLRFEAIEMQNGRMVITLEEGHSFQVPESVIDFRATVLEGSLLQLPAGFGAQASVAKDRGGRGARASSRPGREKRARSSAKKAEGR